MQRPEVKLARRLVSSRCLLPPIDVFALLRERASLSFVEFPVKIDGLCIGLKKIGVRPEVYISAKAARTRQRFTAAHELGHVLIPWHIGGIIDDIDGAGSGKLAEQAYWEHEAEANNFASELLMPTDWAVAQISEFNNPLDALIAIIDRAQVSRQAAAIKLINNLPPNHVIASASDGVVNWSSRSEGTLVAPPPPDADPDGGAFYSVPSTKWTLVVDRTTYHCWHFLEAALPLPDPAAEPWRATLDKILQQIIPDIANQRRFKSSLNGVVAGANSMVRSKRTPEAIFTAMLQRLHANAANRIEYERFVGHPLFPEYARARAADFFG